MKLEPRIILNLLLNFSDFDPRYSYKLYSYKKESVVGLFTISVHCFSPVACLRHGLLNIAMYMHTLYENS